MKKLTLLVISFLFIIGCSVCASEKVTYNVEEIGVMIAFPKEYQVYEENYNNVYITAFADDEALIEVEYDNNSAIAKGVLNLENLSYSKTEILIKHIREDAEEMGLEIKDYNHYVFNRLPFVQVLYHNPETSEKCIQYATIFDSALYSVTLKSYGDEIPSIYEKTLLQTMESFYIYKTERIADTSEYWKNKNYVEYSLDEIGIDISIPSDHIVITKDDLPQFCEQYNVPMDEAIKEFEDEGIYLWMTDLDLTYKIRITAAPVNEGLSFTSDMLNKEEKQNFIERIRKEYSENWSSPSDICIFNLSDLTFMNVIVPEFQMAQNGTVYNSKGLTLTMMVTDGKLTDTHKTLLNDITRTIKFHTPPETPENNIKSPPVPMTIVTTLAPITIIALLCWFIIFLHDRKRNK
ncbi:MAG: hypothetical protein IJ300_03705 [Clostridia bacterium]|nr:hypothetical protein [Clostridia bacterium]